MTVRVRRLTVRARRTTVRVRRLTPNVKRTAANVKRTAANVKRTAASVRRTTTNVRRTTTNVRRTTADVKRTTPNVTRTTTNVRRTTADVKRTTPNVTRTADRAGGGLLRLRRAGRSWFRRGLWFPLARLYGPCAGTRLLSVRDLDFRALAWQERFYDQIVRNERTLAHLRSYIRDNPLRWEMKNQRQMGSGAGDP